MCVAFVWFSSLHFISTLTSLQLESLLQDYEQTSRKPLSNDPKSSPLLPSPEIPERTAPVDFERYQAGLDIQRPGSALHSGDFTEGPQQSTNKHELLQQKLDSYKPERQPWFATSPPRNFSPFLLDPRFPTADLALEERSRAPSLSSSYSSSFVLKAPTSPLVQSESNDELEWPPRREPINITSDFQLHPRRHTLQSSQSVHSTPSTFNRPYPHLRRDNTNPYQAHQPRRSLASNHVSHPDSSPQTLVFSRSRRPSFTSDSSPLLHASMVGSYEESILRGRMSTTPSKPLDFLAQIGVLGLGKCKSSLKCPAHVTIPFPAVFYSYETTSHGEGWEI